MNSSVEPFIRATTESSSRVSGTAMFADDASHGAEPIRSDDLSEVQVVPTVTRSAGSGSGNGSASHMGDSPRPKLKVSPSVKFETNGESGEGQALDTIFESGSYVQVYTQRDVV